MMIELRHRTQRTVAAGRCFPLGAALNDQGVNFAIYSERAREVFLLLFDTPGGEPTDIIRFEHRTKFIWHAFVHGLKAGQLYGFKIRGEFDPVTGCVSTSISCSWTPMPRH